MTSRSCTLKKNSDNVVGISIGGGFPACPCVYIVQIFDNTPASADGTLAAGLNREFFLSLVKEIFRLNHIGDEIVSVNNASVKGQTKVQVAQLIQETKVD